MNVLPQFNVQVHIFIYNGQPVKHDCKDQIEKSR